MAGTQQKKKHISPEQKPDMFLLSNILHDRITDQELEHVVNNGSSRLIKTVAKHLYSKKQSDGEAGFWAVYRASSLDFPELEVWEDAIKTDAPFEEEKPKEVGTLLSDVTPTAVRWLWPGHLPYGKLVMADGDPGLGKTTVLFDIGARLTRGGSMPGETERTPAKGVVLICLEDGLDDTIQPRMSRAGADLARVVSIGDVEAVDASGKPYARPFNLAEDLSILEAAIKRVDAGLVIIDPIMAILGGKDIYKDNEVRSTLAPLKMLAERTGVCIPMIRHVTKGSNDKLIYQGGGSIAFIGLARVGLMFSKNPDDEEQCILTVVKNNLCMKPPKLLYRIANDVGSNDERPYVRWEGVTTITDQELGRRPPQDNQGDKRNAILKYLKEAFPAAVTPQQVVDELDINLNTVTVTLHRMLDAGQIAKEGRGRYVSLSGLS